MKVGNSIVEGIHMNVERAKKNKQKQKCCVAACVQSLKNVLLRNASFALQNLTFCVHLIDILYTLDSASLLVKLKPRIFQRLPPFE
jgi:hypothetical protein